MSNDKYVGFDVPQSSTISAVPNSQGKCMMESILETKADAIRDFLRGLAGSVHVTFEEGTQAAWLYDGVKPLVAEVIVCNPRENKWLAVGNKGDQVDAHKLAQLLRGGQLKPVYHVGAAAQRGCTRLDLHGLNACVQGADRSKGSDIGHNETTGAPTGQLQAGVADRLVSLLEAFRGEAGQLFGHGGGEYSTKSSRMGLILIKDAQRQRPSLVRGWAPATFSLPKKCSRRLRGSVS